MQYHNCCFVYNPYKPYQLPEELNKDNTLYYPETRMTFDQLMTTGRPDGYNIVTDCPYLVPLYKEEEVFYYKDGEWVNPERQTYGTSYELIAQRFWGKTNSIPHAVIDGNVTNIMGHPIKR